MRKNKPLQKLLLGASLCSLLCAGAMAASFTDVPTNAWYAESVSKLADAGVINGITSTTFAPNSPVTRAQFIKLLAALSGDDLTKYQSTPPTFSDTGTASSWWHNAIEWANEKKITTGNGNGHFSPDSQITRQEMATMIARYAEIKGISLEGTSSAAATAAFADESSFASWAENAIASCQKAGLITGYPSGEFRPSDSTTRAQAAKVIAALSSCPKMDPVIIGENKPSDSTDDKKDDTTTNNGTGSETGNNGSSDVEEPNTQSATFADKLYAQMPEDHNYMISPLSMKVAFAMLANGISGDAQKELLDALDISDLPAYNKSVQQLMETYQSYSGVADMEIANSLWCNTDQSSGHFMPDYLSLIQENYGGTAQNVTNKNAVDTINKWVSDKTRGKIQSAIDSSQFSTMLVNTVYFKGTWDEQFSDIFTKKATFTSRDDTTAEIDFMHQTDHMPYYSDGETQMVRLDYSRSLQQQEEGSFYSTLVKYCKDLDMSMYVLLSDKKDLAVEDFIKKADMKSTLVSLSMPKFKIESDQQLNEILSRLGAKSIFSSPTDYSKMFSDTLVLGNTLQKTYINVDENGTEAAAVTELPMMGAVGGNESPKPIEFKANKPFTFVIRDNKSGEILFIGEYAYAN